MDQSGDGKITLAEFEMMFENEGTNMADALLRQWFFSAGQPHTFMVYIYIYISYLLHDSIAAFVADCYRQGSSGGELTCSTAMFCRTWHCVVLCKCKYNETEPQNINPTNISEHQKCNEMQWNARCSYYFRTSQNPIDFPNFRSLGFPGNRRQSPGMQAFLESAEINASDAWTLFASLDVDGDNVTRWQSLDNVGPGGGKYRVV